MTAPWEEPEGPRLAKPGGGAILDQPAVPPVIWGRDKFIAWANGQGTMIASHQGLGKSTIAQQLLLYRIGVRHGDFLGMPVTPLPPEKRVLYLAMDRPMQILQSMRRMVSDSDRDVLDDRMRIWDAPLPFKLTDDPQRLADWVQEVCPGVGDVIVDSVKDLAVGVSNDDVGAAVNIAWQGVIARGIDLLLLHHQRKAQNGAGRLNTLDDTYGSTWLTSGLGSVFALDGEPGAEVVKLKHLKSVMMQLDNTDLRHDHLTGTTMLHQASTVELLDLLNEVGEAGTTAAGAAQAVIGAAGTAEQKRVRRQLNDLVGKGTAEKIKGNRSKTGAEPDRWRLDEKSRWAANLDV